MPGPDPAMLNLLLTRIRAAIPADGSLLVVGLCGAQGSGKSTLCAALEQALAAQTIPAVTLSLDDLYLTRAERQVLAREVHPLFATRGVPGTHDVALGLETIAALERGEPARLPRFDKGTDDRAREADWPLAPAGCRVLLLEGWCVGARPEGEAALTAPVNALEAEEDPEGQWRSYSNHSLAGPYQDLFTRIDLLILLAAPNWEIVARWRDQAEEPLRRTHAVEALTPAALTRFLQHYERLTRWIMVEMPTRADAVVRLGEAREVLSIGANR